MSLNFQATHPSLKLDGLSPKIQRLPWLLVVFQLRVGERSVRCGDEEEAGPRRPGKKVPERPGWNEVGESYLQALHDGG